jgi:hypothetical protein
MARSEPFNTGPKEKSVAPGLTVWSRILFNSYWDGRWSNGANGILKRWNSGSPELELERALAQYNGMIGVRAGISPVLR